MTKLVLTPTQVVDLCKSVESNVEKSDWGCAEKNELLGPGYHIPQDQHGVVAYENLEGSCEPLGNSD